MNWYLEALSKYATFHGRARRKEFWFFALFNFILNVVLLAIDIRWGQFSFTYNVGLFGGIYSLAVLLPGLAVAVRRLHDTNRSGWWLLIALIPLGGAIVLLVFMLEESQPGQNRYGVCPKRINSESPPPAQDSVSWMAIASLVCGVLTLTIFWLRILHLVPGLLAILLAVFGLSATRRSGGGSNTGLAVAGIVCAVIGMLPTIIIAPALAGIGIVGPKAMSQQMQQQMAKAELALPSSITLQIVRDDFWSKENSEAYKIKLKREEAPKQLSWTAGGGGGARRDRPARFEFKTIPAGRLRYEGTFEVTAPKQVAIKIELHNEAPFRFIVEGLENVAVTKDDQPYDLDEFLRPTEHSIHITGNVP